jgi:nanoRNase/pAp phosphatase (c-di-AMP/oligoRNAs hydrolase)
LLLQKSIEKGKGVVIKSFPALDKSYFKKVEEFKADCIFILDKPLVDPEFIALAKNANIPLIWIDHHHVEKPDVEHYYNTFYESQTNEPTSYICYKVTRRKQDDWLCLIGCITDSYLPDFTEEFKKVHPDLIDSSYESAPDILYNTKLGKIAMVISFAMKDKTSNVVSMMKFLLKTQNPNDILEENPKTRIFLKRFEEINEKYQKLLNKVEHSIKGNVLFFNYAGDLSISQYTANQLFYKHPDKAIVVAYTKGNMSNVSLRWKDDIRTVTINALKGIEGATGGGHEHSCGARIPSDRLQEFKDNVLKEIEKINKN